MKQPSKTTIFYFKCPDCGCVTISKSSDTSIKIDDIKTIYCPFCNDLKDFFMFDSSEVKKMN